MILTAFLSAWLLNAVEPAPVFRAGAYAQDITPEKFPVIVNGGFREATTDKVWDRLYARCLVLDDGNKRIAIAVVDSCMVPRDLLDEAKALVGTATGIPVDRMLISSTHTHSAPSAMGALGTDADPNYIKIIPGLIAAGITEANARLQPAQVGWGTIDAPRHTHCRRWILRPDKMREDPFGNRTVRAHMHPGHQNPDFIGPAGPVDTGLTLLSVRTPQGKPLALLVNYSMHYYGASALSADYYGAFAQEFAKKIHAGDGNSGFIAAMSQGTSGDLQWMDYSAPSPTRDLRRYAEQLATLAHQAYQKIAYHPWVSLAMAEAKIKLGRRVADEERLEWARKVVANLKDRKPIHLPDIYAREQVLIAEDPIRELILQAVRIGDLGITAIPNEVYSITGLKLKAQSPLQPTFNIELANGGEGYIPPPEQHHLGGYTTWAARSAALVSEAEPAIVETLLTLLEKVSNQPRKPFVEALGPYPKSVLEDKPIAYWRMGELEGTRISDASGNQRQAALEHGFALHLPGAPGKGFVGNNAINRSVHFAGGKLHSDLPMPGGDQTVEFWFWNGLPHSVRNPVGVLYSQGPVNLSLVRNEADKPVMQLDIAGNRYTSESTATTIPVKSWHHVCLVRRSGHMTLWLDGKKQLAAVLQPAERDDAGTPFHIAGDASNSANFEGRIDETAVYDKALSVDRIRQHIQNSGFDEWHAERRIQQRKQAQARARRIAAPQWQAGYRQSILATKPAHYWPFDAIRQGKIMDSGQRALDAEVEKGVQTADHYRELIDTNQSPEINLGAGFQGGRITADANPLSLNYSVSVWLRNDQPNGSRAVTGYFFSRGPGGDRQCPGDHLGIGGTHGPDHQGKLFVFNGNQLNHVLFGSTRLTPRTWNHVVMIRQGKRVAVYLNGNPQPEIDGELPLSINQDNSRIYWGGRNDNFANLNGCLDEAVVYNRVLAPDEIRRLYQSAGVKAPTTPAATIVVPLSSPALPPDEAMAALHVREGYALELVAAEPLVVDPVAIDWGADGRLWVAEMADYPSGIDGKGKPGGRIRVLEDIDGDGRYNQSTLFADGLNFPTGVMAWQQGVLITAAPNVLYARDTDGDGKADSVETLLKGFFEGNQQLRVNGLRWGVDNWVYCANGSHAAGYGGNVQIQNTQNRVFALGSRDFRFRPNNGDLVTLSGPSQFGRSRDDWGNWFGVQNSYPIWHYLIEDYYLRRNPDVVYPSPRKLLTPSNPKVYPAKAPQKRFHSFEQSGRYTSACSPMIYRDQLLFGQSQVTHAFTCEPFHNLVQHHLLEETGVSFSLKRDPAESDIDFFASADRWCRPVQVRTGPDGALWVVDMYRYMIEHPDWLPPNGKEELRPHYRAGDDRGRIYRVYPKSKALTPMPKLANQPISQLIRFLASPNGIVRDLAQRELIDRNDPGALRLLRELARSAPRPLTRLQSIGTLDGLSRLDPSTHAVALQDPHPGVRRHAIRLLESLSAAELSKVLEDPLLLTGEPDDKTRLQLALTLGELALPNSGKALAVLSVQHGEDASLRAAILSSAPAHYRTLVEAIVAQAGYQHPLYFDLLRMGVNRPADLAIALQPLIKPHHDAYTKEQLTLMSRWLAALNRESVQLETVASQSPAVAKHIADISSMIDSARAAAADRHLPEAYRLAAISLLGNQPATTDADFGLLSSLLEPVENGSLRREAATVLIHRWKTTAVKALLDQWPSLLPDTRLTVINELLAQPATSVELLKSIAAGQLFTTDLNASQRQRLIKHKDQGIRDHAAKALQIDTNADRQKLIATYDAALDIQSDPTNGKLVFDRLCAVCHQPPHDRPVGPDLRSITDRSSRGLLSSILDPNRSIDPRFIAYSIELKNETSLLGNILSESGSSLTLRSADGSDHNILRSEIARLESNRLSLMPEGLEAGMSEQECADVIAFLQTGLDANKAVSKQ